MIAKKISLIIFILIITFSMFADGDKHGKSVEEVLEHIREELNLENNDEIQPDLVNDELLEELGEAVMSVIHPDEKEHALMDRMMGGEGTESLRSGHIMMGYYYLTGNNPMDGSYRRGMMNSGSMMSMMGSPSRNGWGIDRFFRPEVIIMCLLLIILLVLLVFLFIRKKGKNEKANPLELLKIRLAKGEISAEEYENLKKNIYS